MARDQAGRSAGESVDREAICTFLEQVPIDHTTRQLCERFEEQSRIWNVDAHSNPSVELELGRRQEIICSWVDTGPTPVFNHAIKLMNERGTLRELFEMVYAEFTTNSPVAREGRPGS